MVSLSDYCTTTDVYTLYIILRAQTVYCNIHILLCICILKLKETT